MPFKPPGYYSEDEFDLMNSLNPQNQQGTSTGTNNSTLDKRLPLELRGIHPDSILFADKIVAILKQFPLDQASAAALPIDIPKGSFGPAGSNVFVFHLPEDWGNVDLREHFQTFGRLVRVKVHREPDGEPRGFGFVCFSHPLHAARAICYMHGARVGVKKLKVTPKRGEESILIETMREICSDFMERERGEMASACGNSSCCPGMSMGCYMPGDGVCVSRNGGYVSSSSPLSPLPLSASVSTPPPPPQQPPQSLPHLLVTQKTNFGVSKTSGNNAGGSSSVSSAAGGYKKSNGGTTLTKPVGQWGEEKMGGISMVKTTCSRDMNSTSMYGRNASSYHYSDMYSVGRPSMHIRDTMASPNGDVYLSDMPMYCGETSISSISPISPSNPQLSTANNVASTINNTSTGVASHSSNHLYHPPPPPPPHAPLSTSFPSSSTGGNPTSSRSNTADFSAPAISATSAKHHALTSSNYHAAEGSVIQSKSPYAQNSSFLQKSSANTSRNVSQFPSSLSYGSSGSGASLSGNMCHSSNSNNLNTTCPPGISSSLSTLSSASPPPGNNDSLKNKTGSSNTHHTHTQLVGSNAYNTRSGYPISPSDGYDATNSHQMFSFNMNDVRQQQQQQQQQKNKSLSNNNSTHNKNSNGSNTVLVSDPNSTLPFPLQLPSFIKPTSSVHPSNGNTSNNNTGVSTNVSSSYSSQQQVHQSALSNVNVTCPSTYSSLHHNSSSISPPNLSNSQQQHNNNSSNAKLTSSHHVHHASISPLYTIREQQNSAPSY